MSFALVAFFHSHRIHFFIMVQPSLPTHRAKQRGSIRPLVSCMLAADWLNSPCPRSLRVVLGVLYLHFHVERREGAVRQRATKPIHASYFDQALGSVERVCCSLPSFCRLLVSHHTWTWTLNNAHPKPLAGSD